MEKQSKLLQSFALSGIILACAFVLNRIGLFPEGRIGSWVYIGVLILVVVLASLELAGKVPAGKEAKGCSLIALGLSLALLAVVGVAAWSVIRNPGTPPSTGARPEP